MSVLEAPVLAALVTATGKLIGKAIEWASTKDAKADAQAKEVLNEVYDKLQDYFTDHCVKVLLALENGSYQPIYELRARVHPTLQLPEGAMNQFDGEFRYRLEYLRLSGVVTLVAGSEYRITRLGQAFLEEARRRRDYNKVLFAA